MTYLIREVDGDNPAIHDILIDIHQLCFQGGAPKPDTSKGNWWLIYKGNEAMGFAGLEESHRWRGNGYLSRSGVLKEHRGYGLQRRLIRVRERCAARLGYEWMFSDTTETIPSSNNLIECGYRLYRPKRPYGFVNTLYWRKPL